MAKVIKDQQTVVLKPWWVRVRIGFTGAGLGLISWVVMALLRHYAVEPLACRDLSTATACVNSTGLAGNIAAIVVAVLALFVLIKTLQPRPIIIAVASAVILWSLGTYVNGLSWYESLLWAIALYAATYILFGLIARIASLPVTAITAAVTVIVIRILLSL